MNFCKNPHSIYDNGRNVVFNSTAVPNEVINAFLYRILLSDYRHELDRRLADGKRVLTTQLTDMFGRPVAEDDPSRVVANLFYESNEDNIVRYLMKNDTQKREKDESIESLKGYL